MGIGTVLLVSWVPISGKTGQLTGLSGVQWRWVLLTGLLLTAYVATWYAALSRAQAVDVTAVLVFGAVVTALLSGAADGTPINAVGTILVAAGTAVIAYAALRRPAAGPRRQLRRERRRTAGPLLFARYAYPPNALGLCGADTPRTLLEYGDAGASDAGLAEQARTFDGAWPYLDPDRRCERHRRSSRRARRRGVLGRQRRCSTASRPTTLARHVDDRFRGRLGRAREHVFDAVEAGAVPHHCFHVFAVYPWLGLLRTGVVDQPLHILDQCRTTPARRAVGRRATRRGARPAAPLGARRPPPRRAGAAHRALAGRRPRVRATARPRRPRLAALGLRLRRALPAAARALDLANRRALAAVNRAPVAHAVLA